MGVLKAYVDESGQRSISRKSSDHFVLGCVMIREDDLSLARTLLEQMRAVLGRGSGEHLTWKNIKTHSERLKAVQMLGAATFLQASCVVICKRDLLPGTSDLPSDDHRYMFAFRLLLERLSWCARDSGHHLDYTLAQIGRFSLSQLREYESGLRGDETSRIAWDAVNRGGRIDQPKKLELLQLGDIVASATAKAFEPDRFGNTETRYLTEIKERLYVRPDESLRSSGLKMHPWNPTSQTAHPWMHNW